MTDAAREDDSNVAAAAREHFLHWWREPVAGILSLGIGAFDAWHFGRDGGLTASLDEALIIGGVILIAGTQRFIGRPLDGGKQP